MRAILRRLARELASFFVLAFEAYLLALRLRLSRRVVMRQAYELGNRSLGFIIVTMAFIGLIMVLQSGYQAGRLLGDYSLIGPSYVQLLVRELGPTIGAMLLATRVGAGIAAELGSMTVTEQIDALRLCGAEPVEELVVPRLAACALMIPALLVIAGTVAELSGLLTARLVFGVPYATFFDLRLLTPGDVLVGGIKSLTFGAVIPLVSSHAGLGATRGSAGVGQATTAAVIRTSMSIIFLDFVLNVLLYPVYAR